MQDLTFAPEPLQSQGRTLTEHVFKQIQTAIVLGQIPAGSKISEPELARTYGISRGPCVKRFIALKGNVWLSVPHMWARAWFRSHCNSLKSFTKFGLL